MSRGEQRGPSGRSREEWEQLVAAYEARAVSRRAFCAEAGVSATSLDYWRRKFKGKSSGSGGFIEVSAPSSFDAGGTARHWDVELELGEGMVLRLARR